MSLGTAQQHGAMPTGADIPPEQPGHKGKVWGGRELRTGPGSLIPSAGSPNSLSRGRGEDGGTPDLSPAAIPHRLQSLRAPEHLAPPTLPWVLSTLVGHPSPHSLLRAGCALLRLRLVPSTLKEISLPTPCPATSHREAIIVLWLFPPWLRWLTHFWLHHQLQRFWERKGPRPLGRAASQFLGRGALQPWQQ